MTDIPAALRPAVEVMARGIMWNRNNSASHAVQDSAAALRALLNAGWRVEAPPSELEQVMMDLGLI